MTPLTLADTQKLLQGIESLYSIQNLDTFGRDSLLILEQLVPTEASIIIDQRMDFDYSDIAIESNSQDFERLMKDIALGPASRYEYQNPIRQNLPLTLKGAHKISDFLTRQECEYLEAYQVTLKPTGFDDATMMTIYSGDNNKIPSLDDRITVYTLYRPWQKLTERDRLILNLLQPHLIQAYQNAIRWQALQQQLTQLQQAIDKSGVVFLDSVGRVELLTSQAANWLRSYFPSHDNFTELPEQLHSWVKHQLSQFNGTHALPDCCLPLRVQQGNRQLTIRLVIDRLGSRYLLLLAEDRVRSLLSSLELLGLSQREAEVLFGIIRGKDNQDIAIELGIHVSTVRKHLENIYSKLGVQSCRQAIAVALQKLGILNSPDLI